MAIRKTSSAATDEPDSGDPVKIGGIYRSAGIIHEDGDRAELLTNARGVLKAALATSDSVGEVAVTTASDGSGAATILLFTNAWGAAFNGATWDRLRTPNVFKALNAFDADPEATIWDPAAGKKFRLMGVYLQSTVAGNIVLRDNTGGTIICVIPSAAGGDAVLLDLGNGILSAAADNVLTATSPAASTISGMVFGTEE